MSEYWWNVSEFAAYLGLIAAVFFGFISVAAFFAVTKGESYKHLVVIFLTSMAVIVFVGPWLFTYGEVH